MKTNKPFFRKASKIPFNLSYIIGLLMLLFFMSCGPNESLDIQEGSLTNGADISFQPGTPEMVASLPGMAMGSTIGPGGDLYITQCGSGGSVLRMNKKSGDITTFATGLPTSVVPIGGVIDVTFIDDTAYVLVTLVGAMFGDSYMNGIYRIDGPNSYTLIADIGTFANDNPPTGFDFFIPTGLQYAFEPYQDGFLVTDGHHNRVYYVSMNGTVEEFKIFDNIVPTGLDIRGNTIFMAEAGPTPHLPETGRVVSFDPNSSEVSIVGSGAPLLVDVGFNRGQTLFAISQGEWGGEAAGDAAAPDTGSLVRVNADGSFTVLAEDLDRPTSVEFIKNTALITTLTGQVWSVSNVAGPPFSM